MSLFNNQSIGKVFTWNEINLIHKTRNGIYQKGGRLVSLLTDFGWINPCYPDFTGETDDTIFYTGAGRRGDQKMDIYNQAMHTAIKSGRAVPLFQKLKVNSWKFTGFWQVIDAEYVFEEKNERHVWSFVLKRVE